MRYRVNAILVCILLAGAGAVRAADPDVVAVVNGQAITRSEFGLALARSVGRAALNDYVDRALVQQEARRRGIAVTDAELAARRELEFDLRLRAASDSARMGPGEFRIAAQQRGKDVEQMRQEVEESVSTGALRVKLLAEKILAPQVDLSEESLKDYYRRTRGLRYAVAHIMLRTERDAQQMLEVLRSRPELWSEAVAKVSLDRTSETYRGRIGPIPAASQWGKVLAGMQPGELKLHNDGTLWHVVRLIKVIPPSKETFDEVEDRIRGEALAVSAQRKVDRLLADLHLKACVIPNLSAVPRVRRLLGEDVAVFVNGEPFALADMADALVDEVGADMLDRYIERVLILQEAQRQGLAIPERELDARMDAIGNTLFEAQAQQQGWTKEELAVRLPGEERVEDVKNELVLRVLDREDLRAALLAEKLVADAIEITEEEISAAYEEHYGDGLLATQITLESPAEAEQALRMIEQGANFDLLARRQASAPGTLMAGGLILNIPSSHPYYPYARDLKEGEISRTFPYEGKYRIIRVLRRRSASEAPPLESVRDTLDRRVFLREARQRAQALLEKLRAEADIEFIL